MRPDTQPPLRDEPRSSKLLPGTRSVVAFDTLEAAKLDAESSLFEMASEALAPGEKPNVRSIDITDSAGTILAKVVLDQAG
ncbi:DUF6894 family protein [Pararhizobium qamdonense]|uniref:DUF6894 family protein n=1 Tax=Pararhizobium qamdonense TaxID=3031126 RepID=UPI0038B360A6